MDEQAIRTRLSVSALMTTHPVVISMDATMGEISEALAQADVSGAPVVDAAGFLVGVVSQTDLVRATAVREGRGNGLHGLTARHLMTRHPVTVRADDSVFEAARRMERHGIHRVIVLDDDAATPIGVISMSDLMPLLIDAEP